MSKVVDSVVSVGTFGLVDDFSGAGAAADAANAAAGVQASAAESAAAASVAENRRQFDLTQANYKPVIDAGNTAREQQMALLGLRGGAAQESAYAAFNNSPGQEFLRKRAEKSLLRNASAIGGLGGGNVRTALQEQAIGLAQQDYGNQFARLGAIAGQGNAGVNNVSQFGANASNNIANATSAGITNAGAARASGILGGQQARTQATSQMFQFGGAALGAAF